MNQFIIKVASLCSLCLAYSGICSPELLYELLPLGAALAVSSFILLWKMKG